MTAAQMSALKPARTTPGKKSVAPKTRGPRAAGRSTKADASREHQQDRSRASFVRMLNAAEKLLKERGTDNFTLNEVGVVGQVSIGSIYCRFDGKDDLIHAVHARAMEVIEKEQLSAIAKAAQKNDNLHDLIIALVDVIAENLRRHAPILRPLMHRAGTDAVVAAAGKRSYAYLADLIYKELLAYRSEIAHPNPERVVRSTFRIFYSALARYLGFGSEMESALEGNWRELKEDLGFMCAAFLTTRPRSKSAR